MPAEGIARTLQEALERWDEALVENLLPLLRTSVGSAITVGSQMAAGFTPRSFARKARRSA